MGTCAHDRNVGWTLLVTAMAGVAGGCGAADAGGGTGTAVNPPTMFAGVGGGVVNTGGVGGSAPAAGVGSTPIGTPMAGAAAPPDPVGAGAGSVATAPMDTAGSGSALAGTGAIAGMGAAGSEPVTPPANMPCIGNANEVLVVGDSYVAYANPLVPPLEADATQDGQLAAGQHYRNLAVPGTFIAQIENQWKSGKAGSKYVIMDGGGNDILLGAPQCLAAGSDTVKGCTDIVDRAVETGQRMFDDMKASGVAGVVYFFYPHVPAGGDDILDYAVPLIQERCAGASTDTFSCTFVDTRAAFMGHPEHFFGDGIHPSASGATLLASLVWDAMKDSCIGQASGCCM